MTIRVLHYGLGPIGAGIARRVAGRRGFNCAGGVDLDPEKVGRDLGEVIVLGNNLGVPVVADAAAAFARGKYDVCVHCTSSKLEVVAPQIEQLVAAKIPVVSTCEELAFPAPKNRELAAALDAHAKKAGVALVATGVNPGFVMDSLPIALSAACERVDRIRIDRIQDAAIRRLPFQKKIGAGLTPEEFAARVADGGVRHVGFAESISMLAKAMGWEIDRITDDIAPRIAAERATSEYVVVEPGRVCGLIQTGAGWRGNDALIRLHLEAYIGAPASYDAIHIEGVPELKLTLDGGVHGDVATAAMVINTIPKLLGAEPGLRTMLDLPLPSFSA
jgi:2,4-diaminopentanoate dehydrogenase